ncbi:inositol polyphosphate 5-phosphatase OCRL isoform X2 [Eupeodes corollae]|uniref:inositol polyphosphate 5-phosphatase OCRL isoform X2 n=1 Tax=Eupeodes corollae TaxID=290404 RepID=UPI002491E553|nr:inositol polyphosphate 5-phosphatase OCRL isoform X2 [Eupeodes corollae]
MDIRGNIGRPTMTNIPTVSESVNTTPLLVGLSIIQQKFKQGEIPSMLLEAYQIIGNEHANRLLAIVQSTGTHAIFSFNVARLPPQTISDLAIDKIFPLDDTFELTAGRMDAQSNLQFSLKSFNDKPSEFYTSKGINSFENFQKHVNKAMDSYKTRLRWINQQQQNRNLTQSVDNGIVISPVEMSFKWLEAYQKQDADMIAIDRGIADGTKQLKKGETKFQDELRKREKDYIVYKNYRIYCATWNINSTPCPLSDLSLWLARSEDPPDIYVIALQELDVTPMAIGFSESKPDPGWNRKFLESLHKNAKYEQLTSVRLVGMMLTIFVRKELRPSLVRYSTQSVGTGMISFGNKGGVAVSVTFNDATLCFVNSHLAAHMHEIVARNQGFDTINRKCIFNDISGLRCISQHDHIFWIGDLNYRINEIPGIHLDRSNYESLLKFDQLVMEMRKENVFRGYTEGPIKFSPTYKYDPGTDNFDSSEKLRAPAYCDRVLWRGDGITQLSYNSVMEIRQSDHKPVYAEFTTPIKTKDFDLYKRVYEETLKSVDKYENDNRPQITVERTEIDFDEVTFNELVVRDFTVANNCHLPVEFSFEQKERRICEKWLDVEPKSGRLLTGSSMSIRVKFQANSETIADFVQKINSSKKKSVFDILVLQVKDGPHSFISILGLYRPSCFGLSVETLCQTERPVCEYVIEELNELANIKDKFRVSMPREFFLLIDYLYKSGTKTEGLFSLNRNYANSEKINQIRDWLDSWSNEDFPGSPHTAAEALLMLLESPKEPLLKPCAEQLLKTTTIEEALNLITRLSPPRRNMFFHLCLFLREGIGNKFYNVDEIATLYGDILLRKKSEQVKGIQDGRCRLLMLRFLHSDLAIGKT